MIKSNVYEDIENGDLNNNNFIITIDNASELNSIKNITEDDDDEFFDTNYVDTSIALAYSKSLNDIRLTHENVPMRPNSLAICTDDHFMYHSNTNNNDNTKCFINDNDVSTSNSKQISSNKHFAIIAQNKRDSILSYSSCASSR
jgi:hypothetical protein